MERVRGEEGVDGANCGALVGSIGVVVGGDGGAADAGG